MDVEATTIITILISRGCDPICKPPAVRSCRRANLPIRTLRRPPKALKVLWCNKPATSGQCRHFLDKPRSNPSRRLIGVVSSA